MKKITITIAVVAGAALSAFSQGAVAFQNDNAPGYVILADSSHTASSANSYVQATSFTAQLWALSTPTSTLPGNVDAYGYLTFAQLTADSFSAVSGLTPGGTASTSGNPGYFEGGNVAIPGTVNANTVLAVAAWTGGWSSLSLAVANNAAYGIIAFVQAVGPTPPTPIDAVLNDIGTGGWSTLANSPLSAANSGAEDLIMSAPVVVPEPGTMALAALGGASMLLFRRRK
jgi:hypothetical protein